MNRGDVILVRSHTLLDWREEAASRCCAVRRIHRPGQHACRRQDHNPRAQEGRVGRRKVYMPSPVRHGRHSHPHTWLVTWLGVRNRHPIRQT